MSQKETSDITTSSQTYPAKFHLGLESPTSTFIFCFPGNSCEPGGGGLLLLRAETPLLINGASWLSLCYMFHASPLIHFIGSAHFHT